MECPLCYYPSTKNFFRSEIRDYLLCPQCGLIFVPPRFFLPKDEEVARYLEHQNSLESEGYVNMFQEKIDAVAKICPRAKTALDYGCGYEPVLTALLSRAGYRAEGYDANFFPQRGLNSIYDLVISTETFEHFKEPGKEIKTIRSLLAPAGFMAVMTRQYPEKDGGPDAVSFRNWYYQRDPTHICFYSAKTFAWIARSNGFKILYDNGKDFIILQTDPIASPDSWDQTSI